MYGHGTTLLMEPPHIIVSSNYHMKYHLLSKDRWNVFTITEKHKLKNVNISRQISKQKSYETIKK